MRNIDLRKITFGMTSAIIAGIASLGTLFANPHAKMLVISSLLIFAVADNIADTFGMHMYQDSEMIKDRQVWISTLFNYFIRLIISLVYIVILLIFPTDIATVLCIGIGLVLLTAMSYFIAKRRKSNPMIMIIEHVSLAVVVLFLSTIFGNLIHTYIH